MDIRILAEFVSLAETCSFQETAVQMNVSQSSLTKHIKKLEEELGVTLFDRSGHHVKVSAHGHAYHPYARQIVQLHAEAEDTLAKLNAQGRNKLSICFNPLLGQYGLISVITDFFNIYPQYQLQIFENYHCLDLMKSHRCDFAFVEESESNDSHYNKMVYMADRLTIVVRDDHPLANRQTVTLDQLKDEQFILHSAIADKVPDETLKFQEFCAASNFEPNVVADSTMTSTMIHHVKTGRGIAVLNRMRIKHDLNGLKLIDLSPTVHSYIYMLYPKKLSSPCSRDFLRYMSDLCKL